MVRALALGRLLRLSLAPSAAADAAAGVVLAAGSWPSGPAPFALMLASLCVYHGGMALNDWADRDEDARIRPGRPLPSGAVAARTALGLALLLLAAGPLLAWRWAPSAALPLALVAGLALLYDLAGRGPWRGPLLLAGCRAGNLAAGLALGGGLGTLPGTLALAPLGYGLYVFLVSRLARVEDAGAEERARARPARTLALAALVLAGLGGLARAAAGGHAAPLALLVAPHVLALTGALGLFAAAHALRGPAPRAADVERAAGQALRRLLVCSATFALGAGTAAGVWTALAILGGYPLAHALRRVFPPT